MFSLKTNNLEDYLRSFAGYGTYVNFLTLHNLLNVQKFRNYRYIGPPQHTKKTNMNKSTANHPRSSILLPIESAQLRNFLLIINS